MGLGEIGLKAVMEMVDFVKGSDDYNDRCDEMEKSTDSAARVMSGMVKTSTMVGVSLLAVAGVIGIAMVSALKKLGTAAWESGVMFDEAFDAIIVKTGATGAELVGLKTDLKDIFTSIPTDVMSVSTAIGELNTKLDLTGPLLQDVAESLLEVTRMTGGNIQSNSEALAELAQKWGLSNEDLASTLDMVFVATQQSGANLGSLLSQLVQYGPILQSMGLSLIQATSLLASLDKAGISTTYAMMGMRTAAEAFAKADIPVAQGLAIVTEEIKNTASETTALAIATKFFGARAGPEMVLALRNGTLSLQGLLPGLESAEGAIAKTSDTTMDASEQFQIMKNKAVTALEPIGTGLYTLATIALESLMPAVNSLSLTFSTVLGPAILAALPGITTFITEGLLKLTDWFVKLPQHIANFQIWWDKMTPWFVGLGVTITIMLIPAFVALVLMITTSLIPTLVTLTGVAAATWIAFLGPFALVAVGIGLIVTALGLAKSAADDVNTSMGNLNTTAHETGRAGVEVKNGVDAASLAMFNNARIAAGLEPLTMAEANAMGIAGQAGYYAAGGFDAVGLAAGNASSAAFGSAAGFTAAGSAAAGAAPGLWEFARASFAAATAANLPGTATTVVPTEFQGWFADVPPPEPPTTGGMSYEDLLKLMEGIGGPVGGGGGAPPIVPQLTAVAHVMTDAEKAAEAYKEAMKGLIDEGIKGYTSNIDEQIRLQAQLDLALGNITQETYDLTVQNSYLTENMRNLNMGLDEGIVSWDTYVSILSDGVVTTDELATALGDAIYLLEDWNQVTDEATALWSAFQISMSGTLGDDIDAYIVTQGDLEAQMGDVQARIEALGKEPYLTQFQRAQLDELLLRQQGLADAYEANAIAHEEATRRILFDILTQQAAIDGLTQGEISMLMALATQWGLVDEATASATAQISAALAYYAATGDLAGALAMLNGLADAWGDVGVAIGQGNEELDPYIPHSPPPLAKGLKAITKALEDATIMYNELYTTMSQGQLSEGFAASMNAPGVTPGISAAPTYYEGSRTLNLNMGGVNVNSGMDEIAWEARVRRLVKEELKV